MKIPTLVVKFKEYAELDEIKRDAHAHNMNVSEYIRYLVAKERKEREKWKKLKWLKMKLNREKIP